jgi:radical SAM superfamily enzyme YgiQ (UPF0313 family)
MKIAFVTYTQDYEKSEMPLGIAYLSAIAKRHYNGVETRWIFGHDCDTLIKAIEGYSPDIVGFSATSLEFCALRTISDAIRSVRPELPILWGGYHITMLPQDLPASATAAVLGEGEMAFVDLLALCGNGEGIEPRHLSKIKGVAYRDDGHLVTSDRRALVENLDDLPMPDWSLFQDSGCVPSLMSARGCLFKCSFCSSTAFWGNGLRRHSPERVVAEMARLSDLNPNASLLHFYDDTFTDDVHRLERIASIIDEKKYVFPPLWGHGRAALINQRMLRVLKKLKVRGLSFGFESGSNRVLKLIKSGLATMGINFRAALACYEKAIEPQAHIIVGNPGETVSDAIQSLNLIYMTPLGFVAVNTAMPLPGTKFMDAAADRGMRFNGDDYAKVAVEYMDPRLIDNMTLSEFRQMRKKMEEVSAGQALLSGKGRHHLLVGVPWSHGREDMISKLTELYSVDCSVGLHVAVFGVPDLYAKAIYRRFPVIVPRAGRDADDAMRFLETNAIDGIPWAWLEDDVFEEGLSHDKVRQRLHGTPAYVDSWVEWRRNLEGLNRYMLRPEIEGEEENEVLVRAVC